MKVLTRMSLLCVALLALLLILSPAKAEAATSWHLSSGGTMTISGTGNMPDWESPDQVPWHDQRAKIKTVIIEDGVTGIGAESFRDCSNLKNLYIGDSVTFIGHRAFFYCTGLTGLTLPDSVSTIDERAFFYCTGLKTVDFGDGVEFIGGRAFYSCTGLTELVLPEGLQVIDTYAFAGCSGVTKVNIPQMVSFIGDGAFEDCTGLQGVYITDMDAWYNIFFEFVQSNPLEHAGKLYLNNQLITNLQVPDDVEVIGNYAFAGCTSLESVQLGKNVTAIGDYAFKNCTGLTTFKIPDKTNSIGYGAFDYCTGLTEVTIGSGVDYMDYWAFGNCTGLQYVYFTGNAPTTIESCAFYDVTATVYYPTGDATWTEAVRRNYDGSLTWLTWQPPQSQKFEIDVSRMILGNSLEFQFGVDRSYIPDTEGYYAVVEKIWADGTSTTKTVPAEQWGDAGQYYAISYDGVAAKEMADLFYVTVYDDSGEPVSYPKADSVRDYVERAFSNQTTKGKTMMVDMLNYGAAAQQNFGYNTADLANSRLTTTQKNYATQTAGTTKNQLVKGANYTGTRLVLESRIQMQVAFSGLSRTMYAVYTYTDHNGKLREVTVPGSEFISVGNLYGVELDSLVYADARQPVDIKIYTANGTLTGSAKDSIESYVNRFGASAPLYDALIKFTDSAKAFLHQ